MREAILADTLAEPDNRPGNGSFAGGPIAQKASGQVTVVAYLMREGVDVPAMETDQF